MDTINCEIIRLLEAIVQGIPLTQEVARKLESTILDAYPEADDDDKLGSIMYVLASFKPGGAPYLFDEEKLRQECKLLLVQLKPGC